MDLRSDPRMDQHVLEAMAAFGLNKYAADLPYLINLEIGILGFYKMVPNELPDDDKRGKVDYTGAEGPLPCIAYIHGGGMVVISTYNRVQKMWCEELALTGLMWCEELALTGLVVIAIDFRNAYTEKKLNPFPAGLNDCSSGVAWIDAHRKELGITKIVLEGESGGGNLCCATMLKAKRDCKLSMIDGVYTLDEDKRLAELPSLVECDGYFLSCQQMDVLAGFYDPTGGNADNPLAWPLNASNEDMAGLPPHVISVNELDPLRDEGRAYFQKLLHAGVKAVGRVNLGIPHGAEFILRQTIPHTYKVTVADIKQFAYGV
ncbi:alpha/beta-hydrolase [Periconia macrospinosa]|uniref:Alpha/beta-hydrolase n=1 Tax=Periconia macrospinosa TaxID=97972 RepID=A0A2V1D3H8_9PLEO|nr:alpha/beta-hydrolase [Periconia macrospinosa]